MALKAKKKEVAPAVEETAVEETTVEEAVQEEKEPVITQDEKEVIKKAVEEDTKESADTQRLQLATNLVSGKFNLDPSQSVKKFEDKGKVVNLTLENHEFIINVTIKDSDRPGMYIEQ